jgi:hypothetical protein
MHRLKYPDSPTESTSTSLEVWLAPRLDCIEVQQYAARFDRRTNKQTSTYERHLVDVSPVEPDGDGFEVPATYSEKQPSALYRESSEFLKISPDSRIAEAWQKQDKAYFESKSNQ